MQSPVRSKWNIIRTLNVDTDAATRNTATLSLLTPYVRLPHPPACPLSYVPGRADVMTGL